ncbi:MAG: hypothetical protein IJ702_03030 [Fretibacterium sp.]|nr:hypothetical protein [Fretibacterium sp.]
MNEKDFLEEMRAILENDSVTMDSSLMDIKEWDSLSILSFIALAVRSCERSIAPEQIRACRTLRDLYALLQ